MLHWYNDVLLHAGTVMTGSHADAIVLGGRYDGILGVLGGIGAVKGLREAGFKPVKPIEVVQWTSEEADRFTEVCFGRCRKRLHTIIHCHHIASCLLSEVATSRLSFPQRAMRPARKSLSCLALSMTADIGVRLCQRLTRS